MIKGIIEDWAIVEVYRSPYDPPELSYACIHGKFGDKYITTSPIEETDKENEIIITRNSKYKLGTVSSEYERQFPNAKERLFKKEY